MIITCPKCGKRLTAVGDVVGKPVQCASCGERFQVPPPGGANRSEAGKAATQRGAPWGLTIVLVAAGLLVGFVGGVLFTQAQRTQADRGLKSELRQAEWELTKLKAVSEVESGYLNLPFATSDEERLRGIASLGVRTTGADALRDLGVSPDEIRVKAELALRKSGFAVAEVADTWLLVKVNGVSTSGCIAYAVDCKIQRRVPLKDARVEAWGTVWDTGYVGHSGKERGRESIEEVVNKVIDATLNALLSANPKK